MAFSAQDSIHLREWLSDPNALILDIRPHAAFANARIPNAISLSVPSTLLKRPNFSLHRLSAMLPSSNSRNKFSAWPSASRILVYDADSFLAPESSNIAGLLRKFKLDGFSGDLAWLKGGFQAVWHDCRSIVDTSPPSPETEADDDDDDDHSKPSILRTRQLPMAAFSLSSTTLHNSSHFQPATPAKQIVLPRPATTSATTHSHSAFNPFFDTIRQNTELSHGITERIPLRLPRRVRKRIPELPFKWLKDIARKAEKAPHHSHSASDCSSSSESDDDDTPNSDIEEGKEALAMQFFKIELSEQRRLMGIMEHHSRESGQRSDDIPHPRSIPFPYSITAGVEKGAKNRYRHIWPFEHTRVKLHQRRDPEDDYINASYIQPLGTNKRYIATQGPLPATFTDFWTLCWQQNVHVIVMLTREVENAMVKCGSYWIDTEFGPLRLRLVSTEGLLPSDEHPTTAGFFHQHTTYSTRQQQQRRLPHSAGSQRRYRHHHYHNQRSETVKRVFELTHTGYPEVKPRRIVHLQYLEWPDMNVPEDPRGVLGLVKQVEDAVNEASINDTNRDLVDKDISPDEIDEKTGIAKHTFGTQPILLHCSAGVGRTGGFITVDAVLDAVRRELRSQLVKTSSKSLQIDAMDVDKHATGNIPLNIETVRVPISAGTKREPVDRSSPDSGLFVHVPLATPMQIDHDMVSDKQLGASGNMTAGTMKWAENVRDETGINGTGNNSSPSTRSLSQSELTSFESSSEARYNNGSYYSAPSSSLGTSVSGASPSSVKANFPGMNPNMSMKETASELLQAVLHSQQKAAQHRLRTISAPTSQTSGAIRGRTPRLDGGIRSLGSPGRSGKSIRNRMSKPPTLSFDFSNTSPFKSSSSINPSATSDAEIPSRSGSPSADESNTSHPATTHLPYTTPLPASASALPTEELSPPPVPEAKSAKAFDYKEPRRLHQDVTPTSLSNFEDPVWEVVQDMREQRMSLCQSLRQYVFVHAAIIEGSLMVLDEEKEIAEGLKPRVPTPLGRVRETAMMDEHSPTSTSWNGKGYHHPYSSQEMRSIASSSSTSIGKRGASPTELRKEDVEGAVMLSKRSSVKRKQRSGEDVTKEDDHVRYHPIPLRATSTAVHAGAVSAPTARSLPS